MSRLRVRASAMMLMTLVILCHLSGCIVEDFEALESQGVDDVNDWAEGCGYIMQLGDASGVYTFAGDAGNQRTVYCENGLAGGGWRLVSVRQRDEGALFGDQACVTVEHSCSGHLDPDELLGYAGEMLLTTTDGSHWLRVASHPILDDFLARRRALDTENYCQTPHYCQVLPEPLAILGHSANFTPTAELVATLWVMSGGLALRASDGEVIATFNSAPYNNHDGALYINDANSAGHGFGNVVDGAPGALFYR